MPNGPEQRRKTAAAQSALLDVATQRLITHALDALASLVTPSILARSSQTVSVDTAYRLLESPEHTIQMLTNRVIPPDFSSDTLNWPAFSQVNVAAIDSAAGESSLVSIHRALCLFIANNFALTSSVVGRIIDAATITASTQWEGEFRIRDERLAIARQIRAERLRAVRDIDEELSWMVRIALIQTRRRPKTGITFSQMVIVVRALADGCIDRMLLDPESISIAETADAIIDLGYALSEDGLLLEAASRFDVANDFPLEQVVLAADRIWRSADDTEILPAVAEAIGVPITGVLEVFPTERELGDAVLRCLVIGIPIDGSRQSRMALLAGALHRLAQLTDEAPQLVATMSAQDSPDSALSELRSAGRLLAQECNSDAVDPDRLAEQLVATACLGLAHWETTRLLLDLISG